MQLRVGAQAFTLVAVMFALYNSGRGRTGNTAAAAAEQPTAVPQSAVTGGGMQQTELKSSVRL